jgi:Alkylmercury lyase
MGEMTAAELEDLRITIYHQFVTDAAVGGSAALAQVLGHTDAEVRAGLRELATARHIALDNDDNVVMAHPFTSVPLGFSVTGRRTLWWGGCAWDSFAMPHLLPDEPEVLVATRCPNCGRAHAWVVNRERPPEGEQVAHFLVPAARMWDDVLHACAHQRLFCSADCVDTWLTTTGNNLGYVMDLATLWRLAQHWYDGRLDRGYQRRDPTTAAAYFREVGLDGSFWGL